MKNLFKNFIYLCSFALILNGLTGCSSSDDEPGGDDPAEETSGITNINNPKEGKNVSKYGEVVSVSFTASNSWEASLQPADLTWVSIQQTSGSEQAGKGVVRISFDENNENQTREVSLYITLKGQKAQELCIFTQEASGSDVSQLSIYLNGKMDERLKEEYLWSQAYTELGTQIDKNVTWDTFLETNLVKLGNTNIEDGGTYRPYSSKAGQRYIYSYINEINNSGSTTRSSVTNVGTGLGPTFASFLDQAQTTIILTPGYIYPGSPAEKAGLQRGDNIYQVNGNTLGRSNYQSYQQQLFYNTSGTYKVTYKRFELQSNNQYALVDHEATITAGQYAYTPVLLLGIFNLDEGKTVIGYMATESFELNAQDELKTAVETLKEKNITHLILDLRFNVGGAVAQSRWLTSAIAGQQYNDKVFANLTDNAGKKETWLFGLGQQPSGDGLGNAPDLGLKKVYVIMSENTASAAEMLINGLKGIDYDIVTYGSVSEGKNVGMKVSNITYNGRTFEFAPITFRTENAKGFHDFADGLTPDKIVNNQNSKYDDDLDNMFPYAYGDWANADFDMAFRWAYCDITGDDPGFNTASATRAGRSCTFTPLGSNLQIKPVSGRFGSLVY